MSNPNHLVFYDGECGLCDHTVQFILKQDKNKVFAFAPLQGPTAAKFLQHLPEDMKGADSIILIENFRFSRQKTYIRSKAVFRILWLLGGAWLLLGWLSFLPAFLFDWGYRIVAKYRKRLFPQTECFLPPRDQKDRFLH